MADEPPSSKRKARTSKAIAGPDVADVVSELAISASHRAAESSSPPGDPEPQKEMIGTTDVGGEVVVHLRKKLAEMLDATAQLIANRRRATKIDRTDLEAAFDILVNPTPRPRSFNVFADICNLIGGILLGYAIKIITGDRVDVGPVVMALLTGGILVVVALTLKYAKIG